MLSRSVDYRQLETSIGGGEGAASLSGVCEGAKAHVIASLASALCTPSLIVVPNEASAVRLHEELCAYLPDSLYLPARETLLSSKALAASSQISAKRLAVLMRVCLGESVAVVASAETLLQHLPPPEALVEAQISLAVGEKRELEDLSRELVDAGYERKDQCEEKGQFSIRGGILDVFPLTKSTPYRIEFFDDEVDSIRTFDPDTQRSLEKTRSALVPPATEIPLRKDTRENVLKKLRQRDCGATPNELSLLEHVASIPLSLLPLIYPQETTLSDYFSKNSLIVLDDPGRIEESATLAASNFVNAVAAMLEIGEGHASMGKLYSEPKSMFLKLNTQRTLLLNALARQSGPIRPKQSFRIETMPISQVQPGSESFLTDLQAWKELGYSIAVFAGSHGRRLSEQLVRDGLEVPYVGRLKRELMPGEIILIGESLPRGAQYPEIKSILITERELLGRERLKPVAAEKRQPQLAFSDLAVGDFVVHETYGIGRFVGVEALTVEDNTRDYLLIQYAAGDRLYIPTDQLDRVQKYIGNNEAAPHLSKLGGGEWQRSVSRVREGVKKLAFDLVKLYGARTAKKGYAFLPDGAWQQQLEERFPYEETPDQLSCIADVKADMESDKVMDRLLCGDVGYGKTEIAVRAAFKAAMDGRQVAFLVPTTILAQQHYNTIMSRFAGFPVNVELLSRFKTASQKKEILKRIEQGAVDVVIGTHMLLGSAVKFKDLGLLVIDEEQRFGVAHKELIKNIKNTVDVLTLTATPIPRTLHMSMVGIRDMSVIQTPPEQRFPVQTYVLEYSDAIVRDVVLKELGRGGQTYIVYNKVRNMEQYASHLIQLLPEARIAFAHGQMSERVLEKTMLQFLEGQYDVLLCSTIIESGMDIPNVNTIVVCDADALGLSQLYQLRGRVGRSNRLGYAYFTFRRSKVLSEIAEKRLMSIREFTQFGSGFKIAMRDLEIRGAGNLLGPEQHGHMADVGYDLYCKLMNQAVREAKGEIAPPEVDTALDIPIDAHIPHRYIASETQRLSMYKRIALIGTRDEMLDVQEELEDRYGDIPESVQNLLDVAVLKSLCSKAQISRLQIRDGEIRMTFHVQARLDGAKLVDLCTQTPGAQLVGGESVNLVIRRPRSDARGLLQIVPHFVYTILDCIESRN